MVVQHNLTAMNSNRMLGITQNLQAKSSEKLSSGYRINRAADDAAGLAISEKMRKQINGLDQASTNAQDGVSAVQTAEGALTEVHSMLQRMNELAVQASNGTNSESDREAIQAEIEQLVTEIDRVAETTKFNETYLLKGAEGDGTDKLVAAHDAGLIGTLEDNEDGTYTFTPETLEEGDKVTIAGQEYKIVPSADAADYKVYEGATFSAGDKITTADGTVYTYYNAAAWGDSTASPSTANAVGFYTDAEKEAGATTATYTLAEGDKYTAAGSTTAQTLVGEDYTAIIAANINISTKDEIKAALDLLVANSCVSIGKDLASAEEYNIGTSDDPDTSTYTVDTLLSKIGEGDMVFTHAATGAIDVDTTTAYYNLPADSGKDSEISLNEAYEKMAAELDKASSIGTDNEGGASAIYNGDGTFTITQGTVKVKDALNFNLHVGADADMTNKITIDIETMSAANLGIKDLNVTGKTGENATYAIDAIADAITKVSEQRSALGAIQNRLEHTIANLDNVVENTTSAESRIRDTDMAEEMVEYSKNNILAQAGQSMLAQANQATQGVLSLLG